MYKKSSYEANPIRGLRRFYSLTKWRLLSQLRRGFFLNELKGELKSVVGALVEYWHICAGLPIKTHFVRIATVNPVLNLVEESRMVAGDGSGAFRWKTESKKEVYKANVFTVFEQTSIGPNGKKGRFSVLEAHDWAVIVPVVETPEGQKFLMVRQYRHGADSISLEFPGGVVETGEAPAAAAARELTEETGWTSQEIYELASVYPNPALQSNFFHIFIAMNPVATRTQSLDENEVVDAMFFPADEIRAKMGSGELRHALMVSALYFVDRFLAQRKQNG